MNSSDTPQEESKNLLTVPLIDKSIKNTRNMPSVLFIVF